jgi:nitric oxide reductase NorQ protein/cobaltochelatase CobS
MNGIKNLTTEEIEIFVKDTGIASFEIRRKDKYGRLFPNVKGKTAGYISNNKYGVSWNTNFGNGRKTKRITSIEELLKEVNNFGNDKPEEHQIVAVQGIVQDDSLLIPSEFKYYPRKLETGDTDVETFEWAMNTGKNVFLVGPTGSGKTALARFYCAANKRPYRRFSFNGGCTVEDLVGHWVLKNGETIWVDGILTQAVRRGWVLVGDEINAASADVLFVLNSVLDDERILVLSSKDGEVIKIHPDFRFVATCNPTEQGYAGTNELNESLKDRFSGTILVIDYNEDVERKIIKKLGLENDVIEDMMSFVKKLRKAYLENELITPFSTRSVIMFAELLKINKTKLIINRFRDSEKNVVMDMMDMFIYKTKPIDNNNGDDTQAQQV